MATIGRALSYQIRVDTSGFTRGMTASKRELRDAAKIMDQTRTPAERLGREVDQLRVLYRKGAIDQDTYTRRLRQLRQEKLATLPVIGKFSGAMRGASSIVGAFGVTLGAAGIVSGLRSIIGSAEEFEQALASSTAIVVGLTEEQREAFKTTATQVAYQTTFSAKEAAEAYYFLASAGLDATQQIAAMPVVATFAQAGMFDLANATDLLTDAQMALGMAYKDAGKNQTEMVRLGDLLVKANILANASVEQFSKSLTSGAGAALKLVNKSAEEGVAILAAYASQGLKGEAAGTALNIVMRDMQTASLKNTAAWKEHNLAVYDSQGNMRHFADILGDLEKKLDGTSDSQKKMILAQLGFTDKSVAYTAMLLGQSDAIREYERQLLDAGGTMQDVADKQVPALTRQMNELSAEWEAFSIAFAKPIVSGLTSGGGTEDVGMFGYALSQILDLQELIALGWDAWGADFAMLKATGSDLFSTLKWGWEDYVSAMNPFDDALDEQAARAKERGQEMAANLKQLDQAAAMGEGIAERWLGKSRGEKYLEDLRKAREELQLIAGAGAGDAAGGGDMIGDAGGLDGIDDTEEQLGGSKPRQSIEEFTQALHDQADAAGRTREELQLLQFQQDLGADDARVLAARRAVEILRAQKEMDQLVKDIEREEQDAVRRGEQLASSLQTPSEKMEAELDELRDLYGRGKIDAETYARGLEKIRDDVAKPIKASFAAPAGVEAAVVGSQQAAAAMARAKREAEIERGQMGPVADQRAGRNALADDLPNVERLRDQIDDLLRVADEQVAALELPDVTVRTAADLTGVDHLRDAIADLPAETTLTIQYELPEFPAPDLDPALLDVQLDMPDLQPPEIPPVRLDVLAELPDLQPPEIPDAVIGIRADVAGVAEIADAIADLPPVDVPVQVDAPSERPDERTAVQATEERLRIGLDGAQQAAADDGNRRDELLQKIAALLEAIQVNTGGEPIQVREVKL